MSSPEQNPPGTKQFELRATAADDTFDGLLAAFTAPAMRQHLPGYLHLFGETPYTHTVDDLYDGTSQKERVLKAYQRQVTDHTRNRFSIGSEVEKPSDEPHRLRLGIHLGVEAARRLIAPPFFTASDTDILPLVYRIPHPIRGQGMVRALRELREFAESRPRGVVDELVMVESKYRDRSIIARTRTRAVPAGETAIEAEIAPITLEELEAKLPKAS